jgi:hypothetical protein
MSIVRPVDPADYEKQEVEFMLAMDRYKRDNRRPHPTWREVLEVFRSLGYRRCADPSAMPRFRRGFAGHGTPYPERQ